MSDGFMAFKALGWAAAGVLVVTTLMPGSPMAQLNRLRTITSEFSKPGILKKTSYPAVTTTTTTAVNTANVIYPQETTIPSEFSPSTTLFPAYMPNPQPAG